LDATKHFATAVCLWTLVASACVRTGEYPISASLAVPEAESYLISDREETPATLGVIDEQSVLSDYLAYAALNNPGLKAAFDRWKAALERVPQVKALPDPRFTYGYFIQPVETRVGPQRQRFGISQMFPWLGKLSLRGDQAMEAANAEREHFESTKLKLFYQVKNAYYEYYYLARAIAVTMENLQLLRHLENVVRTSYSSGTASYADVVRAQVELGKLEDILRTLQDLRGPISARLNAALNRADQETLPWPSHVVEEEAKFSDEQLISWLKESNPSLKAFDFVTARERVGIDLARKDYFPDVTLGLEVIDTGPAITPNVTDSGKDAVIASVSINLPIWHQKYRAEEREATARYVAARRERKDQENTLVADLKMALYNYRDAERKLDLYRNALIPKAEQAIDVTTQGFEAGTKSFLELIDSERSLLEFRLSYERAFANKAQRLAELEMLVARELPRSTSEPSSEALRDMKME
jgi:outer membrane protein, heavy metal efflux system